MKARLSQMIPAGAIQNTTDVATLNDFQMISDGLVRQSLFAKIMDLLNQFRRQLCGVVLLAFRHCCAHEFTFSRAVRITQMVASPLFQKGFAARWTDFRGEGLLLACRVLRDVRTMVKQFQIFKSVVISDFVFVVNILGWQKRTTKMITHNEAMFKNVSALSGIRMTRRSFHQYVSIFIRLAAIPSRVVSAANPMASYISASTFPNPMDCCFRFCFEEFAASAFTQKFHKKLSHRPTNETSRRAI